MIAFNSPRFMTVLLLSSDGADAPPHFLIDGNYRFHGGTDAPPDAAGAAAGAAPPEVAS
jgi:hypothetical protein